MFNFMVNKYVWLLKMFYITHYYVSRCKFTTFFRHMQIILQKKPFQTKKTAPKDDFLRCRNRLYLANHAIYPACKPLILLVLGGVCRRRPVWRFAV